MLCSPEAPSRTNLCIAGAQDLAKVFPQLKSLVDLNVGKNYLYARGVKILVDAVLENPISRLDLRENLGATLKDERKRENFLMIEQAQKKCVQLVLEV